MRNNLCTRFLTSVLNFVNTFDRDYVKELIGDSVNNDRQLSVRQIVRFLHVRGKHAEGYALEAVRQTLCRTMNRNRSYSNYRSDAFDINELVRTVTTLDTNSVRNLSKIISKVAA